MNFKRIHLLGANALAAIFDFGAGALIAVAVSLYFDAQVHVWTWFLGGFLALLPDMDVIPSIAKGKPMNFDHHQTLFHRPILTISVATLVAFVLGGYIWALIASLCVIFHFLHDTGWVNTRSGIAWFWPLSGKFFSWYGFYAPEPPDDHHEWLKMHWSSPCFRSVFEISIGTTSLLLAMYWSMLPIRLVLFAFLAIILLVLFVWMKKDEW